MAEFRIQRREALAYVALPVEATMDAIPEAVGRGFEELSAYVDRRGIDLAAGSLIRYGVVSPEAPFTVEVGFPLSGRGDRPVVREPFELGELGAGHYAVASQRGPFAWIGGLTRELMAWGDTRGMDYAFTAGGDGADAWDCWYEWYPEAPVEGPQGLEGPVDVCLLLRP